MRCQHFGCDAERDWAKRSKSRLNWFAIIKKSKHFEQVLAGYGRMTGLNFAITKILIGPSLSIFWVLKCSMRCCFVFIIFEAQSRRKRHFHHKHCSVMNCLHCCRGHCSEKSPEHGYRKHIKLFSIWAMMIVGFTGLLVKCGTAECGR